VILGICSLEALKGVENPLLLSDCYIKKNENDFGFFGSAKKNANLNERVSRRSSKAHLARARARAGVCVGFGFIGG
jgi:hypothetical protein